MPSPHESMHALADGFESRASRETNQVRAAILRDAATRIRSILDDFPAPVTYTDYAYRGPDGAIYPPTSRPPDGVTLVMRTVTAWEEA